MMAVTKDHIRLERFIRTIMDERDRRYEQRFMAQEKATEEAFKAAGEALNKAEATSVRDKAQANEWRDAMNDREKSFLTRLEYTAQHQALQEKVDILAGTRGAGLNAAWGYFIGAAGLIAAIAASFFHR